MSEVVALFFKKVNNAMNYRKVKLSKQENEKIWAQAIVRAIIWTSGVLFFAAILTELCV